MFSLVYDHGKCKQLPPSFITLPESKILTESVLNMYIYVGIWMMGAFLSNVI